VKRYKEKKILETQCVVSVRKYEKHWLKLDMAALEAWLDWQIFTRTEFLFHNK